MQCTKYLVIGLCLLIRSEAFLSGTGQTALESLLQPWFSAALHIQSEAKPESPELPDVKRLVTASYKGVSYVLVENVSLGFAQAERYCQNEFTDPMQLASVQSEDEWHMLTTVFGNNGPTEMWLGGTVRRSHSNTFVLHWLDSAPFTYHRFQPTERYRWMADWQLNSHGCIVGSLQSNALGNWSADLAPCTEPRPFVCKETIKPGSSASHFPSAMSHRYGWGNVWNSLLFPHSVRPFQEARPRRPGPFRFQTMPQSTKDTQKNGNSLATTEVPRTVETTAPMTESTTELPPSTSPSSIAPESTVDTGATTVQPTTRRPVPPTIRRTTSEIMSFKSSEGQANEAEPGKIPTFTFFRSAPRALVESTDRADIRLPQSNQAAAAITPSAGIAAQVIPSPNVVWNVNEPE